MTLIDELAAEVCSTWEERHALVLGYTTGLQLGMGVELAADRNMIPLAFPDASRQDCLSEYPYYWSGMAFGRATTDPRTKNRVAAVAAALKLWWSN